jgi:K+ transporter
MNWNFAIKEISDALSAVVVATSIIVIIFFFSLNSSGTLKVK